MSTAGVCCAGEPVRRARCAVTDGATSADASGDSPSGSNRALRTAHTRFMTFPDRLPIPDEVLRIAKRLEDAGYETWCVGGAIRDNLLGLENHDFDLTTSAPPADVQRVFTRTVPVGIEHGTVAVLDGANQPHEVTTFRKDIQTDGRHAV